MTSLSDWVVIFDLDGTLVDSAPDLTAALNRILARQGLDLMDAAEVRPLVGEGARALLRYSYDSHGRAFPEGEEGEALVRDYIATYADRISEHSFLFDDVVEVLGELKEKGATLAVCTNKLESLAFPLLADLGIREFFAEVVCADSLPERKPSPLPLKTIMQRTARKSGVMVGDTNTDYQAARNAGIPALIATFGYGRNDPALREAEVFSRYRELPALISAFCTGPRQT
jgi:phosphoglycolate phosphatase